MFIVRFHQLIGALLLGWFAQAEIRGAIFSDATDTRGKLPADAKGGKAYRRHTFWSTGFHGGK